MSPPITKPASSFASASDADAGDAHQPENHILEVKRLRGPAEVARVLDIKAGDSVVFIRRLQHFDAVPTILEEIWLPGAIFKGLTAERLAEYKGPMYGLFETEFGTQMIRASEKLKAVAADELAGEFAEGATGNAAAERRARRLHVWRPPSRITTRPLCDDELSLPQ